MNNNSIKDIYELSVVFQLMSAEKKKRNYTNSEAIFESLRSLLSDGTIEEKRELLGIDPFIDYNIFIKEFTYYDIEENLKVFDEAIPRLKDRKLRSKKYLLESMAIDYYEDLEIAFVSARLRRKYFYGETVNKMMSFYRNEFK